VRKPPSQVNGIPASEIARLCQVDLATARRWKRGASCPPKTALLILEADLGCFDPAWRGWVLRCGNLVSPEGWAITVSDVLSAPLLRAQVAAYQVENRALRGLAEEFAEDQPLPSSWEIAMR